MPRKFVPSAVLTPTDLNIYAANGTRIPLLGTLTLTFTLRGFPLKANVAVTEAVDEIMLGIDWLTQNRCQWLFDEGVVVIHGKRIPLKARPGQGLVRRVYVEGDMIIPRS